MQSINYNFAVHHFLQKNKMLEIMKTFSEEDLQMGLKNHFVYIDGLLSPASLLPYFRKEALGLTNAEG